MTFHSLFGRHVANLRTSHWDKGNFVSRCTVCDCPMVKPPGMPWRTSGRSA